MVTTLRFRDPILADFVQQSLVADLEDGCRLLAIPVGLLERLGDGLCLGFILGRTRQAFQAAAIRLSQ